MPITIKIDRDALIKALTLAAWAAALAGLQVFQSSLPSVFHDQPALYPFVALIVTTLIATVSKKEKATIEKDAAEAR